MYELNYFSLINMIEPFKNDIMLLSKIIAFPAFTWWFVKKTHLIYKKKESLLSAIIQISLFILILTSWDKIFMTTGLFGKTMESIVYSYEPAKRFNLGNSSVMPQNIEDVLFVMSRGTDGEKLLKELHEKSEREFTSIEFNYTGNVFSDSVDFTKKVAKRGLENRASAKNEARIAALEAETRRLSIIESVLDFLIKYKDLIILNIQAFFVTFYMAMIPYFFVVSYLPVVGDGNPDSDKGLTQSAIKKINTAIGIMFWKFYLAISNQIFVIVYYLLKANDIATGSSLTLDTGPRLIFICAYFLISLLVMFSAGNVPAYGIAQGIGSFMGSVAGGVLMGASMLARTGANPLNIGRNIMSGGKKLMKSNADMVKGDSN